VEWVDKKAPRLQLARLRVEIGNGVDHLLHLNVAKSQVIIPHDLKDAFESYINDLKDEAKKEFFNRGIRKFPTKNEKKISLFEKSASNKGTILEINSEFPILKLLQASLSSSDNSNLNVLMKMINTEVNKIRHVHQEKIFMDMEEQDGLSLEDLKACVLDLLKLGVATEVIKNKILPDLGFEPTSLPIMIHSILDKENNV